MYYLYRVIDAIVTSALKIDLLLLTFLENYLLYFF